MARPGAEGLNCHCQLQGLPLLCYLLTENKRDCPSSHKHCFNALFLFSFLFRFLGGAIAEYICEFIESGEENENIIHNVFNYDRWIEKNSKTGNAELMTKDEITNAICTLVRNVHQELLSKLDLKDMFKTKRRQFFQLKRFQEKVDVVLKSKISGGLNEKITSILKL